MKNTPNQQVLLSPYQSNSYFSYLYGIVLKLKFIDTKIKPILIIKDVSLNTK